MVIYCSVYAVNFYTFWYICFSGFNNLFHIQQHNHDTYTVDFMLNTAEAGTNIHRSSANNRWITTISPTINPALAMPRWTEKFASSTYLILGCVVGRGLVGQECTRTAFLHLLCVTLFHVFICSAMEVNTSLKIDLRINVTCCWKWLVFGCVPILLFLDFSTTPYLYKRKCLGSWRQLHKVNC